MDESDKIYYGPSPGQCCVGVCAHSRPALELERDKTDIPEAASGMSGEGSNTGTVPTKPGWLVSMVRACNFFIKGCLTEERGVAPDTTGLGVGTVGVAWRKRERERERERLNIYYTGQMKLTHNL